MATSTLIPGMTQANYAALVASSIDNEGLVNGIWNSILQDVFTTRNGVWTISPEVRMGDGYADFLINRNTYVGGVTKIYSVIFEGKDRNGPAFPNILNQLRGYTRDLPVGKVVYLIGAKGQKCAFWRFTKKANPIDEVDKMWVDRTSLTVKFTTTTVAQEYDIVTANWDGQSSIRTMLEYILQNPPAFANELLAV